MIIVIQKINKGERLTVVCEEEPRKTILVRGHSRMVKGKKVYVKPYYRKR